MAAMSEYKDRKFTNSSLESSSSTSSLSTQENMPEKNVSKGKKATQKCNPPQPDYEFEGSDIEVSQSNLAKKEEAIFHLWPLYSVGRKLHLFQKSSATSFHPSEVVGVTMTSSTYSSIMAWQTSMKNSQAMLWDTLKEQLMHLELFPVARNLNVAASLRRAGMVFL